MKRREIAGLSSIEGEQAGTETEARGRLAGEAAS